MNTVKRFKMTFPHYITLADKEDSTYYVHLSDFKRPLYLKMKSYYMFSAGLDKNNEQYVDTDS